MFEGSFEGVRVLCVFLGELLDSEMRGTGICCRRSSRQRASTTPGYSYFLSTHFAFSFLCVFVGVLLDFEMKGIGASRLVGEAQGKELQPLVGIPDFILTPNASVQSGSFGDVLLHATAVSWVPVWKKKDNNKYSRT